MGVAPGGVGLPQFEKGVGDRGAVAVGDLPRDGDALARWTLSVRSAQPGRSSPR